MELEKYSEDLDRFRLVINGIEKDPVDSTTIIDFGWYVKSVSSREGIKHFITKINGEPIEEKDFPKVDVRKIRTLELATWDWARNPIINK